MKQCIRNSTNVFKEYHRILCYFLFFFLLQMAESTGSETRKSIACTSEFHCNNNRHKLNCTESQYINITAASYGYKRDCTAKHEGCDKDKTCCEEGNTTIPDCLLEFGDGLILALRQNCSDSSFCEFLGKPNLNKNSCKISDTIRMFNSYSKIMYECIDKGWDIQTKKSTTEGTYESIFENTTSTTLTYGRILDDINTTYDRTTDGLNTVKTTNATDSSNTTRYNPSQTEGSTSRSTNSTHGTELMLNTEMGEKLAVGEIVGVIVGVLLVVIGGVLIAIFILVKRKNAKEMTNGMSLNHRIPNMHYETVEHDVSGGNLNGVIMTPITGNYTDVEDGLFHCDESHGNVEYNHIGEDNSASPNQTCDNYNHISMFGNVDGDNYHHITDSNDRKVEYDTEYNHVSAAIRDVDNPDYHTINGMSTPEVVANENYNHIGAVFSGRIQDNSAFNNDDKIKEGKTIKDQNQNGVNTTLPEIVVEERYGVTRDKYKYTQVNKKNKPLSTD